MLLGPNNKKSQIRGFMEKLQKYCSKRGEVERLMKYSNIILKFIVHEGRE